MISAGSEYPIQMQVNLVMACAALHNFIHINTNNSDLEILNLENITSNEAPRQGSNEGSANRGSNIDHDDSGIKRLRDQIAEIMWRDYINYRR